MSESKHTPGPWEVHKMTSTYQIPIWAESKWIGNIDAGIDADIAEANARLIAAAPELLEACKEAFGVLTEPGIMDVDKWKGWRKLTVAKLREAIEQAEKGTE